MKNNMTSKLFEAASSVNKGAYELSKETLVESQRIVEEMSDEEIIKQLKDSKFCPRCGRRYNGYPAISRYDNETEICPDCGVEEAMINFTGGHLEDPHVYDEETGEELIEEEDEIPSNEDLEKDDKAISEDKKKEIEDRIAELKLALEDEAISEDEKEDVKKEISDLENSLNECSSKENLNEDDSDEEDDDSDEEDDNKEDKNLLDSDNYQDVIQFLIDDENEAIDGYNKAKDRLSNLLSEDEYTKYLEVIEHIISEENEHIEELTKVLNGEPVDLNHDKDSNEEEEE